MTTDSDFASTVRSHAQALSGSRYYFLWSTNGRYPSSAAWPLEPFAAPIAPPGEYSLGFLHELHDPLQIPPLRGYMPTVRLAGGADAIAKNTVPSQSLTPKPTDSLSNDPTHHKDRVEHARMRLADDLVLNTQLVGKQITLHQELGEMALMARHWRQESVQTSQSSFETLRELTKQTAGQAHELAQTISRHREWMLHEIEEAGRAKAEAISAKPVDARSQFLGFVTETIGLVKSLGDGTGKGGLDALSALVGPKAEDLTAKRKELADKERELAELREQEAKQRSDKAQRELDKEREAQQLREREQAQQSESLRRELETLRDELRTQQRELAEARLSIATKPLPQSPFVDSPPAETTALVPTKKRPSRSKGKKSS